MIDCKLSKDASFVFAFHRTYDSSSSILGEMNQPAGSLPRYSIVELVSTRAKTARDYVCRIRNWRFSISIQLSPYLSILRADKSHRNIHICLSVASLLNIFADRCTFRLFANQSGKRLRRLCGLIFFYSLHFVLISLFSSR
jgi:hypothetical protein